MLARPTELTRVLELCQTALQIVDFSNPDRLTSSGTDPGTYIAHCYDVKVVLFIPPAPERKRLIDIWHNKIVLSVEWEPRGAKIHKFIAGKWEDRLRLGLDGLRPRLAAG